MGISERETESERKGSRSWLRGNIWNEMRTVRARVKVRDGNEWGMDREHANFFHGEKLWGWRVREIQLG